jgi:1,4-alpha-glucan branching enzyme
LWVVADDTANSVYAFLRRGRDGSLLLVVSNMTRFRGIAIGFGFQSRLLAEALQRLRFPPRGSNVGNGGRLEAQSSS